MKKLILVVAMAFVFEGVAFSASVCEINVKGGLGVYGSVSLKEKAEVKGSKDDEKKACAGMKISGDLLGECLFPVNDLFKIGLGGGYLYPRKTNKENCDKLTFSYLPLYATVQINPISPAKGVFFKGNIGYAWLFNSMGDGLKSVTDEKQLSKSNDKDGRKNDGGLYLGAEVGYEFSNSLILGVAYHHFSTSCSFTDSNNSSRKWDCGTSLVSINVGCNLMKLWDTLKK